MRESDIIVTIFTPVFNRAELLRRIYHSLEEQTHSLNFEWLIVDDGSTDNIDKHINYFQKVSKFPIVYVKQQNGGKHRAINKGVTLARGDLFFIVDSDDYLSADAIEFILKEYKLIKDDTNFAGLAGLKVDPSGNYVINSTIPKQLDCSCLDFRYRKKIKGDIAEVYLTKILKQYPFPDIPNEVFCSESIVWNRIGVKYKLHIVKKGIYVCEYLDGGLSDNSLRLRAANPKYAKLNAYELAHYDIPYLQKVKAYINFWRFALHDGKALKQDFRLTYKSYIYYPIGVALYLRDIMKLRKT